MSVSGPPAGYRQSAIGGTLLVVREEHHDAVRTALGTGTLHGWAATQPGARAMQGRGVAWAARLPGGVDVVVRHSRHGGMLAGLTGDLFLAPTRAPHELDNALRLQAAGVATPSVVAYAVYSAFGPLCRADVMTLRVHGVDLPAALDAAAADIPAIAAALNQLLRSLAGAGAIHPDLNARNVLIDTSRGSAGASVIDVDRVVFGEPSPARVTDANARRLAQSLNKLRRTGALRLEPAAFSEILATLGVWLRDVPQPGSRA